MEEKQLLKELLDDLLQVERDLKISMCILKNKTPDENKLSIIKNLNDMEEIYNRNLEDMKKLDCNYIKKDLKKISKVLDRIKIYKEKIKLSINEVTYGR